MTLDTCSATGFSERIPGYRAYHTSSTHTQHKRVRLK